MRSEELVRMSDSPYLPTWSSSWMSNWVTLSTGAVGSGGGPDFSFGFSLEGAKRDESEVFGFSNEGMGRGDDLDSSEGEFGVDPPLGDSVVGSFVGVLGIVGSFVGALGEFVNLVGGAFGGEFEVGSFDCAFGAFVEFGDAVIEFCGAFPVESLIGSSGGPVIEIN